MWQIIMEDTNSPTYTLTPEKRLKTKINFSVTKMCYTTLYLS